MVEVKKARNVFRLGSGQQNGDDREGAAILSFVNLPDDRKLDFGFLERPESVLADEDCQGARLSDRMLKVGHPRQPGLQIFFVEKGRQTGRVKPLGNGAHGCGVAAVVAQEKIARAVARLTRLCWGIAGHTGADYTNG